LKSGERLLGQNEVITGNHRFRGPENQHRAFDGGIEFLRVETEQVAPFFFDMGRVDARAASAVRRFFRFVAKVILGRSVPGLHERRLPGKFNVSLKRWEAFAQAVQRRLDSGRHFGPLVGSEVGAAVQ